MSVQAKFDRQSEVECSEVEYPGAEQSEGDPNNLAISVNGLSKSFGDNHVLRDVNCDLPTGRSLVILGGSGTGKSVFFKCLTGLLTADRGTVTVLGERPGRGLADVGMLFQAGALFDSLKVWENIAFEGLHGRGNSNKRITKSAAQKLARERLVDVELEASVADRYPSELSGGMIKRVSLARAVAFHPKLLLLDEPTAGLDPQRAASINQLIRRLVTQLGAAAVTITHDLTTATTVADEVRLLKQGRFVWTGTAQEMLSTDVNDIRDFIDPILRQQGMTTKRGDA